MKKSSWIFCLLAIFASIFLFADSSKTHVVSKGETLYAISKKYGLTVAELKKANKLESDDIKIGQKLTIPEKTGAKKDGNALPPPAKMSVPEKTEQYTVQKGDTLYSIAKRFDISVEILQILNEMSGSVIKVGQKISVPQKAVVVEPPKQETKVATSTTNATTTAAEKTPTKTSATEKTKTDGKLLWPVKYETIEYVKGKISGVVLTGKKSEDVVTVKDGTVMFSGIYRGFGQVVFVKSSTGLVYVYTGLENIFVKKGDYVEFGAKVGTLGIDIHSGKPQLNFMVFKNGKPIDPAKAPRGE